MKATDQFQEIIKQRLDELAEVDEDFSKAYKAQNKTLKGCVTYILNQVQKSGINGFADAEVYDMARQYYENPEAKEGKEIKAKVVINRTVELTDEEKEKAKQKAFDEIVRETKDKARRKKKPEPKTSVEKAGEAQAKAKKKEPPVEPTLF